MLAEAGIVVRKVIEAFDTLGIEYAIGGSVASTIHGIPRLTADVDLVAELREEHVAPLAPHLEAEFYADPDMMRAAIGERSFFNIIHLPTMIRVDVFVLQPTPFAARGWTRRQRRQIGPDDASPFALVMSAEDMALQKLLGYRMTGERSDRKWGDVQGILMVQGARLDLPYLRHWARALTLTDLLTRALDNAGLPTDGGPLPPAEAA